MKRTQAAWALLVAALLALTPAARAESLKIPVDYNGSQIALPGLLEKPAGAGPFPVVILLHGCGGNDYYAVNRSEAWGALLRGKGYATLIIDSFGPRGFTNVCNNGRLMPPAERAKDIYASALALSARPDIRHDAIAAMGFSHGGGTVLNAVLAEAPQIEQWRQRLAGHAKIAAYIGFYPGCRDSIGQTIIAPLLILVGASDDWAPAGPCRRFAAKLPAGAPELRLKVYPDAFHDFDYDVPPHKVIGHQLAYNPVAAADARVEVPNFLQRHLP